MVFLRTQASIVFLTLCLVFLVTSQSHADTLTGGSYTIDGGPTAISSATNQAGGTYSAATTATPAGGYVSGGTLSGGGTSPVIGFTTTSVSSTTSGSGGAGGVFIPTPVVIESIVTTPTDTGATVTVTFSSPVDAHLLYSAGDTTHVSEVSPSSRVHTFTLHNLAKATTYPFSFSARSTASTMVGTTVSFGGFSFTTGKQTHNKASGIQGQVYDDAGTPLSNVSVHAQQIRSEGIPHTVTALTDEAGRYALETTRGHAYAVRYDADGHATAVAQVHHTEEGTEHAVMLTRDGVVDEIVSMQCVASLSWIALITLIGVLSLFCFFSYLKSAPRVYVLMSLVLLALTVIYSFLPCTLQQALTSVVL